MIIQDCSNMELTELHAIWYGISLAIEHGLQSVFMKSDSLVVVSWLNAQKLR